MLLFDIIEDSCAKKFYNSHANFLVQFLTNLLIFLWNFSAENGDKKPNGDVSPKPDAADNTKKQNGVINSDLKKVSVIIWGQLKILKYV